MIALGRRTTSAAPGISVLAAHGEPLVRAGLWALLEREPDLTVVAEASRGEELVALAGQLRPDVVVIDVRLPGLDALRATRQLLAATREAGTRVLMMGRSASDEELFGALHAGASGFLAEETGPGELVRAIRCVAEGGALLSPSVTRRLIDELASQPDVLRPVPERLEELTAREREVMGLVAMGSTNREIAARLVVSPATVKTHVGRAMMKLHARDRAHLVALAYQTRLVEPRGDR